MNKLKWVVISAALFLVVGCTEMNKSPRQDFPRSASIAVLPLANHTETPQAGKRVTSMLAGILRTMKQYQVSVYRPNIPAKALLENPNKTYSMRSALSWARRRGAQYAITGAVNEWRYKVGLDGEPVASVTLRVINLRNNKVVWSSVGSKIGGSRSGLSNTGQLLLNDLLSRVNMGQVG
ncbi:MAG: hypothetical protein P1U40_07745 [Coxiellaceae bacterium]|nr:hypothetical protein [Coxiellaceae bacterium]